MPNAAIWRAEARTFAAYLGSPRLPAEVADRYQAIVATWEPRGFDALLGRVAAWGRFTTSLADAYARRVRPYGDLRRRLTLMLALLESHGATHAQYDHAKPASLPLTWLLISLAGASWLLRTAVAFLLLAPIHLFARFAPNAVRK
jgi:hypothetical protein